MDVLYNDIRTVVHEQVFLYNWRNEQMRMQQNYLNMSDRELRGIIWKIRRRKQIRSRIMLFIMTVCLIFGLVLSLSIMVARADTGIEKNNYKYFSSIMVGCGDNLLSIAEQYIDDHYDSVEQYVNEVIHINNLKENEVKAGQYLVIPYYSDEFVW